MRSTQARAARFGAWLVFAIFAAVCLYSIVIRARAKPFWHDEVFTILHSELPSVSAMWAASRDGIDLSPPLNTWLTRAVHGVAGVGHVATRVPPIAGFLLAAALVFEMLRRRTNTATALAGAALPCLTAAYRYSYEARGYGVMVGIFALALFAWSEAARGGRRHVYLALLAAALAATVWNHYYGMLTFIPIAGGEIVRTVQRRKLDAGILGAFIFAAVALLPLYPLAAAARSQTQTFWSPASWSDIAGVYRYVFSPLVDRTVATGAIALAALCLALRKGRSSRTGHRTIPAHEAAAGILSLLIPVCGVALGVTITGVFVPRYAMPAVVGFALVVPLLVWRCDTRLGAAELLLCGFTLASFGTSIWPSLLAPPTLRDPVATRPLLTSALASGAPVVSNSSLQFLQYWYYTPHAMKGRLRYLADPDRARALTQSDTIDRGYLALRRWTPVAVERYDEYVAGHREFRVHEAGSGWLLRSLRESGANVEEIGRAPGERLYAVRLP